MVTSLSKKIAFVVPWFGLDILGGSETEVRELALHLLANGQELEILSTCAKSCDSDWNKNFHKPGYTIEKGIPIRRFEVRKRDTAAFDAVNTKLMKNMIPLSAEEEQTYAREMVNSPDLYSYMEKHKAEYSLFIFIPYMFGTTYYGLQVAPEKSILIPCLHDESYIHMEVFKNLFSKIAGMIFHAKPEKELANSVYDLKNVNAQILGEGIDTDLTCDADAFRKKFKIKSPFVLYAGRKATGKNVHVLLRYFAEYKKRNPSDLKLVLIGGGKIEIPDFVKNDIVDLGFVDVQDKYNACAAAEFLCQPSPHESFSLVIMESWLCGRPVLVFDQCEVTKNFCIESNGGLYFSDYFEFEGCTKFILQNKEKAGIMGKNGRRYVKENFAWEIIVERYMKFFMEITKENFSL